MTEFEIEVDDTVLEDEPAPGAGSLGVPGEIDIYNFVAAAGTEVYFDEIAPVCEIHIVWQLQDEDGVVLFGNDTPLWGCSTSNEGSVGLERGGLYSLTVEARAGGVGGAFGDIDDGVGSYSFRLWPIHPGAFDIAVGDTVSEGTPGPGAGTIETPGNYDVYTFQADAGTTIHFDEIAPPCGVSPVWDLFDPDGAALFESESLADCPGPGEKTLTLASTGPYTIVVRVSLDLETTSPYSFRLTEQWRGVQVRQRNPEEGNAEIGFLSDPVFPTALGSGLPVRLFGCSAARQCSRGAVSCARRALTCARTVRLMSPGQIVSTFTAHALYSG